MTENTLEKIVEAGLAEFDELLKETVMSKDENWATKDQNDLKDFIRTLSLTIAQATHDAVSVEEKTDEDYSWGCGREKECWNAAKKEMHERFTRFLSGT